MSEILKFLDGYNFMVDKSEIFIQNHEEFVYCYNKQFNVGLILKAYLLYNPSEIMEDVLKVRTILRRENFNIWNSYFLILVDNKQVTSEVIAKIYNIERNSKGLRKYVILDEDDMYRIPFIKVNHNNITTLNFTSDFSQILITKDEDLNELIQWVIKSDGEFVELKKELLKEKINEILYKE